MDAVKRADLRGNVVGAQDSDAFKACAHGLRAEKLSLGSLEAQQKVMDADLHGDVVGAQNSYAAEALAHGMMTVMDMHCYSMSILALHTVAKHALGETKPCKRAVDTNLHGDVVGSQDSHAAEACAHGSSTSC